MTGFNPFDEPQWKAMKRHEHSNCKPGEACCDRTGAEIEEGCSTWPRLEAPERQIGWRPSHPGWCVLEMGSRWKTGRGWRQFLAGSRKGPVPNTHLISIGVLQCRWNSTKKRTVKS